MWIPFDLDDRVTASAVAAAGTIIGALIQLRIAWKRELSDRARGAPVTKKTRRGPVLAVFVLLIAAGVGGFAFSESLVRQSQQETAALRGELRTELEQINATAARLELAARDERAPFSAAPVEGVRPDETTARASEASATVTVGPCHKPETGAGASAACGQQDAQPVTLCASVPASATVTESALYARPEDSQQAWEDSRVAPGGDVGRARFADKLFERTESTRSRQVCTSFSVWDGDHAYSARLMVRYTPAVSAESVANGSAPSASPAPNPATTGAPITAAAPVSPTPR